MIDDCNPNVGLLTNVQLHALGQWIARAWPIERTPMFEGLLTAIDEADEESEPAAAVEAR